MTPTEQVRCGHLSGRFSYPGVMEAAYGKTGYYLLSLLQFMYPFLGKFYPARRALLLVVFLEESKLENKKLFSTCTSHHIVLEEEELACSNESFRHLWPLVFSNLYSWPNFHCEPPRRAIQAAAFLHQDNLRKASSWWASAKRKLMIIHSIKSVVFFVFHYQRKPRKPQIWWKTPVLDIAWLCSNLKTLMQSPQSWCV